MFFSKIIGVDIGTSAIKIVDGRLKKNQFEINNIAVIPLPLLQKERLNQEEYAIELSKKLALALKEKKLSRAKVNSSVYGNGIFSKKISLPEIPKKEIQEQIRWEAEQVFPTDIRDVLITHQLIGNSNLPLLDNKDSQAIDILLLGIQKEDVEFKKNIIEYANAQARIIDIDQLASASFIEQVVSFDPTECIGLVDIGASGTQVSIRKNSKTIFMRNFGIGGNSFSNTLSTTLGLEIKDAEALKINDGSGIPQEAKNALQATLLNWKAELQQCEDIFVSNSEKELVDRWIFYGGAFLTPGLQEILFNDRIGQKAQKLPVESMLHTKKDQHIVENWSYRLMSAAGLCLRNK